MAMSSPEVSSVGLLATQATALKVQSGRVVEVIPTPPELPQESFSRSD